MTLLVDTSVWSLALRRDVSSEAKEIIALREALDGADSVVTTGLVLQELLQGFNGPTARQAIIERFGALPLIQPDRQDHIGAARCATCVAAMACRLAPSTRCSFNCVVRYEQSLLSADRFLKPAPSCANRLACI